VSLFRERREGVADPRRFRADDVTFAVSRHNGRWHLASAPGAEVAAELFLELAAHVGSPTLVTVDDRRSGVISAAPAQALGTVRDVLVRVRPVLARYGGVGIALEADDERFTLTPWLTVECDAPTDRWRYLFEGRGLVLASSVPTKQWRRPDARWEAVPDVAAALQEAADRLGLVPRG
jgi:hypothetical protein